MHNHHAEEVSVTAQENHKSGMQKPKMITAKNAVIIALVLIVITFIYYQKGLLIAATVNGSPISRLAVIQELEKRSGKAALDAVITRKLIDDEASKKGIVISDADIAARLSDIEKQVIAQGGTLDQALTAQGIKLEDLKKQLITQSKVEKLLGNTVQVTDAEVAQFIKDNKVSIPKGQEAVFKNQITETIKQQKTQDGIQSYVASLQSKAKINYFVKY